MILIESDLRLRDHVSNGPAKGLRADLAHANWPRQWDFSNFQTASGCETHLLHVLTRASPAEECVGVASSAQHPSVG